jgi:DNA modification methylase
VDKTEFYQHDQNWSNRMILGDSLQAMASLAEREGLRGKVQCFYFDPPYGIKFNSNFQWSTTSRDVKDGKADHKLNSKLQSDPPEKKADAYRKTGLLIAGEVADAVDAHGWKRQPIEDREETLLKWAASEWAD